MALPDFQSFFKPLLEFAVDGNEHSVQEARQAIAKTLAIPEDELKDCSPAGFRRNLTIGLHGPRVILCRQKCLRVRGAVISESRREGATY